jgi:hypothetical protein
LVAPSLTPIALAPTQVVAYKLVIVDLHKT